MHKLKSTDFNLITDLNYKIPLKVKLANKTAYSQCKRENFYMKFINYRSVI